MPRVVMEALALAPAPAPAPVPYNYKSLLLRMVVMPNLEAKVILAWVIWFILRILQSILGPWRRRSRHWLVQYGAMAAYYLPTLIAFYTANAVFSSDSVFKVSLSIGCFFLLFSCARGAVTMTAFTLGDSRLQSWRLLPWLLYFAWLQWGFIWFDDHKLNLTDIYYFIVLCIAPVLYVLAKPRAETLDYETKLFADYMVRESRSSPSPFFDGGGGEGANSLYEVCKYPILQLKDGGWINFSDVLKQCGRHLAADDCSANGDPADVCLSYTFCRLLARRYFGFPCAEVGDAHKVRDFVLTDLVAADYKRAFTIVEVQLALLHDYFFTNYHSDIKTGVTSLKQAMLVVLWVTPIFVSSYVVGALLAGAYKESRSAMIHLLVLAVPVVVMYMLVVFPKWPFLPRYWHPVRSLFLHCSTAATDTESPSPDPSVSASGERPPTTDTDHTMSHRYYWREKLGQYSLMEDCDRSSLKKKAIAWCKVHVLSQASYSFMAHHPGEEEDATVPESLRKFLAEIIRDIYGRPPNDDFGVGTMSPGVDDQDSRALGDVSWTINLESENLTHTILIWHIATCYCHMSEAVEVAAKENPETIATALPQSQELEELCNRDREAAKILSQYCAYLVAFTPELLPEHSLTVKSVLQQVLKQTRDELQVGETGMSMEAKRRKIDEEVELPADVSSMTTFQKGVHLGQQLKDNASASFRWKTMAVFWAKMILYVAAVSSSDKSIAAAHVEQLAQGGEFVTHLWALLCNAGIVIKPGITEYIFSAMVTSRYRQG